MHYLVAVAPVVEQPWAEAFGDLDDVDQASQYSQSVHDDKEAQRLWAPHPAAVHSEQEEAEAKQSLPDKCSQTSDVGARCGGAVDPIGRQDDVDQQGSVLYGWVA